MRKHHLFDDVQGPTKVRKSNVLQQQQQEEEEEQEQEQPEEQEQERIWAARVLRSCTKAEFCSTYTYICRLPSRRSPACRAEPFHSLPCVFYSFLWKWLYP